MIFSPHHINELLRGHCVYSNSDHAIEFHPDDSRQLSRLEEGGVLWLSIDTLQISVSLERRSLIVVEGYCPSEGWIARRLPMPTAQPSQIVVEFGQKVETGLTYRFRDGTRWQRYYDSSNRWLYIGPEDTVGTGVCYEFAEQTFAVLRENQLCGLWLRPEFAP